MSRRRWIFTTAFYWTFLRRKAAALKGARKHSAAAYTRVRRRAETGCALWVCRIINSKCISWIERPVGGRELEKSSFSSGSRCNMRAACHSHAIFLLTHLSPQLTTTPSRQREIWGCEPRGYGPRPLILHQIWRPNKMCIKCGVKRREQ